jgi:hypothetical protein
MTKLTEKMVEAFLEENALWGGNYDKKTDMFYLTRGKVRLEDVGMSYVRANNKLKDRRLRASLQAALDVL